MSEPLGGWYQRVAADPASDIAPHFATFGRVVQAVRPRVVVELGVREGHSTAAWLYHLRGTGAVLWSVDLEPVSLPPRKGWTFVHGNDLDPLVVHALPAEIGILFVDTSHDYDHTVAELATYGPRVQPGGAIVLHDTANEQPWEHDLSVVAQEPWPVRRAMVEYADAHGYDYGEDERSWGLGIVWVPQSA